MQVWGFHTKFGGAIKKSVMCKSAQNTCLCPDHILQETLGIIFSVKSYGITFYRSLEINHELSDSEIVFFSKSLSNIVTKPIHDGRGHDYIV